MESLTLWDYSDRELLHVIRDAQDPDTGYVKTATLAEILGLEGDGANSSVGSRLAWLRRWGAVNKHERKSLWTVTLIGEQLMNGTLSNAQQKMVEGMAPEKLLMLTRAMTGQYRAAGTTASNLIRREWKRGTEPPR